MAHADAMGTMLEIALSRGEKYEITETVGGHGAEADMHFAHLGFELGLDYVKGSSAASVEATNIRILVANIMAD
jgi:hypothetical protein